MKNEFISSIYFGKNLTLFAVIERTDDAFVLHYLNSLNSTIDINQLESPNTRNGINELTTVVKKFSNKIKKCFVTLTIEDVIITKIPGNIEPQSAEFVDLINLEIRQNFPTKNITNYRIKSMQILANDSNNSMFLTIMIEQELIQSVDKIISMIGLEVTDVSTSQISAINTLSYNYPDVKMTNIIVNVYEEMLEYLIMQDKKLLGYESVFVSKDKNIFKTNENKITNILKELKINQIENIYYFGTNLTKENYTVYWEVGMQLGGDTKRLNPFRMFKNNLEKRDIEYCARTFHIYPPCIGGVLPTQIPIFVK